MKILKKLLKGIKASIKDGRLAIALIFLALGAGTGAYIAPHFLPQLELAQSQHQVNSTYHFISPLLDCGTDQNIDAYQAQSLQVQFQDTIKAHEDAGDITTASVYFRDLNGGPYIDVNADQLYSPGSLLKVPLAITIYKESETDPTILQKQLEYTGNETDDSQYFAPAKVLTPGRYTINQLMTQMLVNSDNNAASVLATFVGPAAFDATYEHLGVAAQPIEYADYTTTTHSLGAFFTILYNATYLTPDDSEQLLKTLSETTFNAGIVAGVPPGIQVSHKFGERSYSNSLLAELHDCGIVYAPDHPYVICIMTEGYNYDSLAKVIAELSNVAYNYVE